MDNAIKLTKMSKNLNKRKKLFDKFSKQLHLLKDNGLISINLKFDKTYICPICLDQFSEDDIVSKKNQNFLTEEDAPPEKLNGSRIALRCKDCNSKAGYQIDSHLIHSLRNLDDAHYLNNESQRRKIKIEGGLISGDFTPKGNGVIEVSHSPENNNPSRLEKFIYNLQNSSIGQILNITPRYRNVNNEYVNRALLKTSYILTFSKFGYIFLLDKFYDSFREQIKEVGSIYERQIFIRDQFERKRVGTYYVFNLGAKSIFNLFPLNTKYSETLIGSILPLPGTNPEQIHSNLVKNGVDIGEEGKVGICLNTSDYDPNANLFEDLDEIKKIINWVKSS